MADKKKKLIEHRHPTLAIQKNVLAASGNQCAFPGCPNRIFDLEHETLLRTVAHIKARSENRTRFGYNQTEEENDPAPIINEGTKQLDDLSIGIDVPIVIKWFRSDSTDNK